MSYFSLWQRKGTPIRRMLFDMLTGDAGETLYENTATGNPATFQTAVAKALKSLVVPFTPVQAGTGDPSPDNVRAISGWQGLTAYRTGKNLMPSTVYQLANSNINIVSGSNYRSIYCRIPKSGTYRISRDVVTGNRFRLFATVAEPSDGVATQPIDTAHDSSKQITFSFPEGYNYLFVYLANDGSEITSNIMVNSGNTAEEYEPYTGNSFPVVFPATGKNLFDKSLLGTSTSAKILEIPVKPNTTYTMSTTRPNGYGGFQVQTTNTNLSGNASVYEDNPVSFTTSDGDVIEIRYYNSSNSAQKLALFDYQLEEGSTATAYEPYTNTVYGGSLDLVSGVLSIEWARADMGGATWTVDSNGDVHWFYSSGILAGVKRISSSSDIGLVMCDRFKTGKASQIYTGAADDNTIALNSSSAVNGRLRVKATSYNDDADAFKTAMNGVYCYYGLETPQTIQLDPVTIQTLIGNNTVWTDTNGTNTVVFLDKTQHPVGLGSGFGSGFGSGNPEEPGEPENPDEPDEPGEPDDPSDE